MGSFPGHRRTHNPVLNGSKLYTAEGHTEAQQDSSKIPFADETSRATDFQRPADHTQTLPSELVQQRIAREIRTMERHLQESAPGLGVGVVDGQGQ